MRTAAWLPPALLLAGLLAAGLPLDPASGHWCVHTDGVVCDPYGCITGQYHDHTALTPIPRNCVTGGPSFCPTQPTHNYVAGGKVGFDAQTVQGGEAAGSVTVWHATTSDCDGDGRPGGWDGDYENGIGGGFFGWGPWANEPICDYGLNVHGGDVAVHDIVLGGQVRFVVGENDQSGPIFVTDPTTNEVLACATDGSITPSIDTDDCISPTYVGPGSTCGSGGGDGGFWVFLEGLVVTEDGAVTTSDPATMGTITAF